MARPFAQSLHALHKKLAPKQPYDIIRPIVANRMRERILDLANRKWTKYLDYGGAGNYLQQTIQPVLLVDETATNNANNNNTNVHKGKKGPICEIYAPNPIAHIELSNIDSEMDEGEEEEEENTEEEAVNVDLETTSQYKTFPEHQSRYDAVLSLLHLHFTNDLHAAFSQIHASLKPNGVFMATMIGQDTLYELRTALQLGEIERKGGFSPRVSPMAYPKDIATLLKESGFVITTVDVDEITLEFPDALTLMEEIISLGEENAISNKSWSISADSLIASAAAYEGIYGEDNKIPATFQIIHLIGWKPSETTAKPLPRGSGQVSLKGYLEKESRREKDSAYVS